tara:strand:+ start:283 stop:396 length:114 start_codon:yes stop_codon:yes gene_type:complete
MKNIFVLAITILLFAGCGKKSDPEYQGKTNLEVIKNS